MALDRSWYNALLDDAGDGLSGSVWDKADIKALLDSVDAEILRVQPYDWVAYNPALEVTAGAWTGSPHGRYMRSGVNGKTITVQISVEGSAFSAVNQTGKISLPFPAGYWAGFQMVAVPIFINGVYEIGHASIDVNDPWYWLLGRTGGQSFPVVSSVYVRSQMVYQAQ